MTLYSGSSGMAVKFTSGGMTPVRGFSLLYQQVTGICGPSMLTAAIGSISSPNYPNGNYPNSLSCKWTINVDFNQTGFYNMIALNFASNSISQSGQDILMIQNAAGQVIASDSGSNFPPINITGTTASLNFTTSPSVIYGGFQLNWIAYSSNPCSCGNTNRTINSPNGQQHLYSPNYPSNYCNFELCTWYLHVPAGLQVQAAFEVFNIESGYDTITVYDGYGITGTVLEMCTGSDCKTVESSSNWMTVVFVSDYTTTSLGFDMVFQPI